MYSIIECSYLQITLLKMEVDFQDFRGIFCSLFWKKPIADSGNFCTLPIMDFFSFFNLLEQQSSRKNSRLEKGNVEGRVYFGVIQTLNS